MSSPDRRKRLQEMRAEHADIGEKLEGATVGSRPHELLSDLHYHLGHVIEITDELLTIEERGGTVP